MGSAPVFPYPGGVAGEEPPDPTAGAPGHFAWSRWIKQFVKNLDVQKVAKSGDTMTGPLVINSTDALRVNLNGKEVAFAARDDVGQSGTPAVGAIVRMSPYEYAQMIVADPVQFNHAATKGYVDSAVRYGLSTVTTDASGMATITDCPSTHWLASAQQGNAVAGSGMWVGRINGYTNQVQIFDFTGTAPAPRVNSQIAVAWIAVKK